MPMDSIAIYVPAGHPLEPEIRYAMATLVTTMGASHRHVPSLEECRSYAASLAYLPPSITEDELPERMVGVRASSSAQGYFLARDAGLPDHCAVWFQGRRVHLLFPDAPLSSEDLPMVWTARAREKGRVVVPADLFASAFWFLSRWEELFSDRRDEWGRFRYVDSGFRAGLDLHSVDDYLRIVEGLLKGVLAWAGRRMWWLPRWSEGAPFAFCVTHDIDALFKWHPRRVVGELGYVRKAWREAGLAGAWERVQSTARNVQASRNPYDNVQELGRQEQALRVRGTYFFLAGRRHPKDGDYDLERDLRVHSLFSQVRSLGHEIALHGSFSTYGNAALLRREKEVLEQIVGPVVGHRQHFLHMDVRDSWDIYREVGFEYDSSLGFPDHEGSRAGFSFPFSPFDIAGRLAYPFLEMPLTVMDASLYGYQGLGADAAWERLRQEMEHVKEVGGCFTLLWHNASFDDADLPGYGEVFWRAVSWAQEQGAWIAPMGEVARWWRERAQRIGLVWE